jgi:dolichyl-phosphate-mannose-protein mannosyltransferase
MQRFVITLFIINLISAALFIGVVNRPVYDDQFNIFDVHNYAVKGLTMDSLLSHRNPPGPTSFLWMAAGVRFLGGDELTDARISIFVSWVLLAAGILVGVRYSRFPQLWLGALLATLVFPHSVEATATLLTEGPALLFAVLGVLAWAEFASRPNVTSGSLFLGLLGGFSMGLAVTCRQYFLALLPAAALFALYQWRARSSSEKSRWAVSVILSLALAIFPVLLMVLVWKGISSPGMATGTSYDHMWKATVGLNLLRPMIVAFYAAVYLLPFTFPAMFRLNGSQRRIALLIAVLGGLGIAYFSSLFLQPGPLNSLVRFASRAPHGGTAVFALAAVAALYNAVAIALLIWDQRTSIASNAPALFSVLVVLFFVAEQIGVGGNLPFYDRYVLQLAPFLGIIAFSVLPRLTPPRFLALAGLSVLSHIMLWRFAFAS